MGDWEDSTSPQGATNRNRVGRDGTGERGYSHDDDDDLEEDDDRSRSASGKGGSRGSGPLLALGGAVVLELLVTGSLVITPLAAAALALLALPAANALGAANAAAREAEAVRRTEARVRAEMAARVPVTPPESAEWMARLMGELWEPYVQPMVLGENLGNWADKIRRAAPAGFELELVEMRMGKQAPRMSNFQVLAAPSTGRITAVDCDLVMDSSSIRAVVAGSGPLGRFKAALTGISVRGPMRLVPIPSQRMLLFSFRETPQIEPRLTVKGPFLGQRDIPPTSLLRSVMASVLADCLVEPRRGAISLDPEPLVGQPIDTIFNIYVESVQGISGDGAAGAALATSGPAVSSGASGSPSPPPSGSAAAASNRDVSGYSAWRRDQGRTDGTAAGGAALSAAGAPSRLADTDGWANGDGSGGGGGGGGAGASASSMVAAASSAAVAAGEAVVEGAGAIASLVPGLTEAAVAAVDGGAKRKRRRRVWRLQVTAQNTDNKLQRSTEPVEYLADPATPVAVAVNQLLQLNVGHKDSIFKLMIRDTSRSGGVAGSAAAAAAAAAPMAAAVSGGVGVGVGVGGPPGLLGSVTLHVAAAKDGSTLFWAAREGGEPVAVRWRPSDGPWRVTLPLESPSFGLPIPTFPMAGALNGQDSPPAPPSATSATDVTGGAKSGAGATNSSSNGGGNGVNRATGKGGDALSSADEGDDGRPGSNGTGGSGAAAAAAAASSNGKPRGRAAPSPALGGEDGGGAATTSGPPLASSNRNGKTDGASTVGAANGPANGAAGTTSAAAAAGPSSRGSSESAADGSGGHADGGRGGALAAGAPSITLLLSTDPWVYKDASAPGALYDSPRPRSLVLQIVEARDLDSNDWAGTCDPYVRIMYGGRTYRTRTLYNCHTPVWQQMFVLPDDRSPLRPTVPARSRLSLAVFDSGVSLDDKLGSALLNLDMASEHELQDRWVPLQGVESGWLRIRLAAVPDAPDSAAVRRMVSALEGLQRASEPLLQVVVLEARALEPKRLVGMPDTYCNITYGSGRHVTPIVKQSRNPRWTYCALFYADDAASQSKEGERGVGRGKPDQRQGQAQAQAQAQAQGQGQQQGLRGPDGVEPSAGQRGPGGAGSSPVFGATALGGAGAGVGGVSSDAQQRQQPSLQQSGQSTTGLPGAPGDSASTAVSPARAADQPWSTDPRVSGPSASGSHAATGAATGGGGPTARALLPPYPPVPGAAASPSDASTAHTVAPNATSASAPSSSAAAGNVQGHTSPWPQKRPPGTTAEAGGTTPAGSAFSSVTGTGSMGRRARDVLRIEVMDVDPVPPDDELGVAELSVTELLPDPWDSWQGWVPLRRAEGGEVLVRLSRIEPLPLGQRPPKLSTLLRQQAAAEQRQRQGQAGGASAGAGLGAARDAGRGGPADGGGLSVATISEDAGGEGADVVGQGVAAVERALLDNFTEQARVANRTVNQLGQDLRVRLGQDLIPKLQDWWGGTLQRTAASLEPSGDQVTAWMRKTGIANWGAGFGALYGSKPALPSPPTQRALPPPTADGSQSAAGGPTDQPSDGQQKEQEQRQQPQQQQQPRSDSVAASRTGSGRRSPDSAGAAAAAHGSPAAVSPAGSDKSVEQGEAPNSSSSSHSSKGQDTASEGEDGDGGAEYALQGGKLNGGKPAGGRGGLGQLFGSSWSQFMGRFTSPGRQHEEQPQPQQQDQTQEVQGQKEEQQQEHAQQGPLGEQRKDGAPQAGPEGGKQQQQQQDALDDLQERRK